MRKASCYSHLGFILCILITLVLFQCNCASSSSDVVVSRSSDTVIGHHLSTNMSFQARSLDGNIILSFEYDNRTITVSLSTNSNNSSVTITSYDIMNGGYVNFGHEDSRVLKQCLQSLINQSSPNSTLDMMLLRVLNLLYSWPENTPLFLEMDDSSIVSLMGENPGVVRLRSDLTSETYQYKSEHITTASIESICHRINKTYKGGYFFGLMTLCTEWKAPIRLVGPYPFNPNGCFGRCGMGCVGDGVNGAAQNTINIFTRDCFNHDACVRDSSLTNPCCADLFLLAADDFLKGPSCTPVMNVTIGPKQAVNAGAQWKVINDPFNTGWHANGFSIDWLPTGKYTIAFKDIEGWTTPPVREIKVAQEKTVATYGLYKKLDKCSLSGVLHVNSPSGSPLQGATIACSGMITTSDADGKFGLSNIPSGSLKLDISKSAYNSKSISVSLKAGQNYDVGHQWLSKSFIPNPTIAQTPENGPQGTKCSQSGDGFTPNSDGTLYFQLADGSYKPFKQRMDQNGHFKIDYIFDKVPGKYSWYAIDNPSNIKSNVVKYEITKNSSNTGSIDGRLHESTTSGPVLPGVLVSCVGRSITTNSDGSFLLSGIPIGTQTVTFSKSGFLPTSLNVLISIDKTYHVGEKSLEKENITKGPDGNIKKVELSDDKSHYHHSIQASPGQSLEVEVTVTNKGDESINYFEVRVHRSDDIKFDSDNDYLYGREEETDDLAPGASQKKHRTIKAPTVSGTYYVFAYINRVDAKSGKTDQDLSNNISRADDPEEFAIIEVSPPNESPTGSVDSVDCTTISGWARDANTTDPLQIHIYQADVSGNNKQCVDKISANQFRQDLNGYYGFSWPVPANLKDGIPRKLYFYAINIPAGENPVISGGELQLVCASQLSRTRPAYRFFNSKTSSHFFTIDESEKNKVSTMSDWISEGISWHVYDHQEYGSIPIYRVVNGKDTFKEHFYTASISERDTVVKTLGWINEGIAFYAYKYQAPGTTSVYRYYNAQLGLHFFTLDPSEQSHMPSYGYQYDGIAFYAYTSAQTIQCSELLKGLSEPYDVFNIVDVSELEKRSLGISAGPGVDVNGDGVFTSTDVVAANQCLACDGDFANCSL